MRIKYQKLIDMLPGAISLAGIDGRFGRPFANHPTACGPAATLEELGALSRRLGRQESRKETLGAVLGSLIKIYGACAGMIMLYDRQKQVFRPLSQHNIGSRQQPALHELTTSLYLKAVREKSDGDGADHDDISPYHIAITDAHDDMALHSLYCRTLRTPDGMLCGLIALYHDCPWEPAPGSAAAFIIAAGYAAALLNRHTGDENTVLPGSTLCARDVLDDIQPRVWIADNDGRRIWSNRRENTDRARNWPDTVHPADRDRVCGGFMQSLSAGTAWEDTFLQEGEPDEYRWVQSHAAPHYDADGQIRAWIGTDIDITEQQRRENYLRDAKRRAEAASEAKSEFLANMSHEIRTPMNVVVGLAEILERSHPLTAEQKDYIKTLQVSADAMLGLVDDLLHMYKIEAGSVEIDETPFNADDFLEEVTDILRLKAADKDIALISLNKCRNQDFIGDTQKLQQIVMNLCANAIKFTAKGSVKITMSCRAGEEKGFRDVFFEIRDTGIGISEEKRKKLFQKFSQGGAEICKKFGGTGLGLVIVKNLVDRMNGGIDLESVEGEGTCFTVRIPLRIAPRPHMFRPHRFMTVKAAPAEQKQKTGKASLPVLVVESNEPNALAATATLRDLGYRYDVVKNGREAVRKFTAQKYALILMNIRMEDMNGLEATRLIRRIEKKKNLMPTPIIAAMGQASEDRRESCLRAGMDGFIAKPLRRGDMAALLHRHAAGTKKNDGGFLLLDDLADENITDTAHRLD